MATIETPPTHDLNYRILTSVDEIQMSELQNVYRYWLSIKGDREAPDPGNFDLLEIADLITTSGIVKVIDEGNDFRVLFLGQGFTDMIRNDYTDQLASEVPTDDFIKRSLEIFELTTSSRSPVLNGLRAPSIKLVDAEYIESLTMPLIKDGVVKELAFACSAPYLD